MVIYELPHQEPNFTTLGGNIAPPKNSKGGEMEINQPNQELTHSNIALIILYHL